jgi:hypothetical protein
MKHTHTPGPFPLSIVKVEDHFVIVTNQGNHYAKTFDPSAACLILAAPDMFDALQAIVDAYGDRDTLLMAQCRAALAKAKGEA